MVWTALPFEDWLMLLLLLLLLMPLLGSLFEPSESQPELAPAPHCCMAIGALPAVLHDLAPPPPALRFATACFWLHSYCLTTHNQLRLCSNEYYRPSPTVLSAPTYDINAHLLCCLSSPNMHGLLLV